MDRLSDLESAVFCFCNDLVELLGAEILAGPCFFILRQTLGFSANLVLSPDARQQLAVVQQERLLITHRSNGYSSSGSCKNEVGQDSLALSGKGSFRSSALTF